ncbi:MAG: hypothetical protein ACTSXX_01645 [Candidatus Baldrarchaeia archaeon]
MVERIFSRALSVMNISCRGEFVSHFRGVDFLGVFEESEQPVWLEPLTNILRSIRLLSDSQIDNILLQYASEKVLNYVKRLKYVDIRALAALLIWISERYHAYGRPLLDVMVDVETGEFQFLEVVLPECDWESWKRIAREVKEEMKKAGLVDMASRVAIVCPRALRE